MKYCVITKTKSSDVLGNHYDDMAVEVYDDINKKYIWTVSNDLDWSLYKDQKVLSVKLPVFHRGEILLLDDSGREICGMQRKPSKWFIEYEEFKTLKKAIVRALEITKEMENENN